MLYWQIRFYDVQQGAILCNGNDISELDLKEYRKSLVRKKLTLYRVYLNSVQIRIYRIWRKTLKVACSTRSLFVPRNDQGEHPSVSIIEGILDIYSYHLFLVYARHANFHLEVSMKIPPWKASMRHVVVPKYTNSSVLSPMATIQT